MIKLEKWNVIKNIYFDTTTKQFNNYIEYYNLEYRQDEIKVNHSNILKSYNNKWFNIYNVLNDFILKRDEQHLLYFNYLWFDIDSNNIWLNEIIKLSQDKLNLIPYKINKTYKWYHVYYKLSDNLKLLDKEQYKELYKIINETLEWDQNMKSITWILKDEWYLDNKIDKLTQVNRNFIIKSLYLNDNKENDTIQATDIKRLLKQEIIIDNDREQKLLKLIDNKEFKSNRIEQIDALEFINLLNKKYFYNIKINNENNIDDTNWLKLYYDTNTKLNTIKDFSWKNRFWIKHFYYNYVSNLKNLWKDDKNLEFWKILREFWINWNETKAKTKIETQIILWTRNKEFFIEKSENNLINSINKSILEKEDLYEIIHLLVSIRYLTENEKETIVKEKELLETIWIVYNTKNKNKIRSLLLKLSYVKKEITRKELLENKIVNITKNDNIFEYETIKDNKWSISYRFNIKNLWLNLTNIDEDLFNIKDSKKFVWALLLKDNVNINRNWRQLTVSLKELKEQLWVETEDWVLQRLKSYKKEKIIKEYNKKCSYIIYKI